MTNKDAAYEKVTARLLAALETADPARFKLPWVTTGTPRNAFTDRRYGGGNVGLLSLAALFAGYTDPRWATFPQIRGAGGMVTKGEKGWPILLYKRVEKKGTPTAGASHGANSEDSSYFLVSHMTVFNVAAQSTGCDLAPVTVREHVPTEAEIILTSSGATFRTADRAAYRPSTDEVLLPGAECFVSADAYYSVAFHELTHWTGAASRLDRGLKGVFGSREYAREELVAELGSAMIASRFGIDYTAENADYIAGWLRPLGNNPKELVTMARDAAKAAEYLYTRAFPDVAADQGEVDPGDDAANSHAA